jgi:hypothetical protein
VLVVLEVEGDGTACIANLILSDSDGLAIDQTVEDCVNIVAGGGTDPYCGDGECNGDEDSDSCPEDCESDDCPSGVYDCAGVCDGTAVEDCAGECGGSSSVDLCGECGGGETNPENCAEMDPFSFTQSMNFGFYFVFTAYDCV